MKPEVSNAAMVLCGGASRRMGFPKAMLKLGDSTFLETVVRAVAKVCPTVIVVAAPEQPLPELEQVLLFVRDRVAHQGPLAAIAAGLERIPGNARHVFVTGTDTPMIRPGLIEGLFRAAEGHDLAIATDGQRIQPLMAVYEVSFAKRKIDGLMSKGILRAQALTENANVFEMPIETMRRFDPDLSSLRNVNDPNDYRRLLADLGLPEPDEFRNQHPEF